MRSASRIGCATMRGSTSHAPLSIAAPRVLADEPRHAALGWQIVDWLLDTPSGAIVRDTIKSELARWTAILEAGFAGPELEPHFEQLAEDDLAWGLATPDDYSTIFHEVAAQRLDAAPPASTTAAWLAHVQPTSIAPDPPIGSLGGERDRPFLNSGRGRSRVTATAQVQFRPNGRNLLSRERPSLR